MTNTPHRLTRRTGRRGFSLLEVILALAILTGALAVLGELVRGGLESARIARDTTCALLLCESKMAEITSGMLWPEPAQNVPLSEVIDPTQPAWLYSVEPYQIDQQGLIAVRVTVSQDLPPQMNPVSCSLVRWLIDPGVDLAESETGQEEMPESGTGQ
ncbi:MAG: prepilin-type N-terminal cleavage/methylation domain-containing protein [Thermoguttaceae bacterium]